MKALLLLIAVLLAPWLGMPLAGQTGDRAKALLAMANRLEDSEPQEALGVAKEGVQRARLDGDPPTLAALLTTVAYCSSQTGDLVQAVNYASEALALSTRLGNRERMAKAHNILGMTYTFMGSYSRALDEGLEALRIRQELGLETAVLQSLNMIGVIYHRSGQYPKAIEFYQSILDRAEAAPGGARRILANLNIGFAKYKMGRFQEALQDLLAAADLARRANEPRYLNYTYVNLGLVYTDLHNYPEAARNLQLALAGYRRHDQKYGRIQVLNAMGRLDLLTGQHDPGICLALEGAGLAQQIQARDELKTSYELLSALFEKKGEIGNALKYYKLYSTTKDSIFTAQESERIADISMKTVALKKDYEIDSLKKEREIATLKLRQERYASFLLTSGVVTLLLFVMALVIYGKKTRDGKLLLEAANGKLLALNAELQENIGEVKTLTGLLPICAKCKNIRDDDGYWQKLEGYISKHTSAVFSHGICPHCAEELYPEVMEAYRERGGES